MCGEANIRRGAADILPTDLPQRGLQLRTIELPIPQEDDRGRGGYDRLQLGDQRTMDVLREMALLTLDDDPDQGQRTATVDHTNHEGDTTAPNRSEERRVGKECRYRWSQYH